MNERKDVIYSAYVGIDWADSKHDVCIQAKASDEGKYDVVKHRSEAIDVWVKDLHQRYPGYIAVESTAQLLAHCQKEYEVQILPPK